MLEAVRRKASSPRTCVIGAGISGLVTCKALGDAGVPHQCFETRDRVGGLWAFEPGRTAAYRSLHINTSRQGTELRDFPMPKALADYPHHSEIADYLRGYAESFGLGERVRLGCGVERVEPAWGGGFRVRLGDGTEEAFDAVVVANGHHADPSLPPKPPGSFDGVELHARDYVDPRVPHDLVGKRVVVVGFGNSAVDIACELGRAGGAKGVSLSVRRGAWVLPRYALGKPLDQSSIALGLLPAPLRQSLAEAWYRRAVGRHGSLGLPEPDHRLGNAHPTVSSELPGLLRQGRVAVRGVIIEHLGDSVRFADGSIERADAIVYATGYRIRFPFFAEDFVSAPGNEIMLYLRVFHPEVPGLAFVGLCQPLGSIFPVAEAQAKLIAAHLAGHYPLPSSDRMRRAAARERRRGLSRFGSSPRHTMQVDVPGYLRVLTREIGAGP